VRNRKLIVVIGRVMHPGSVETELAKTTPDFLVVAAEMETHRAVTQPAKQERQALDGCAENTGFGKVVGFHQVAASGESIAQCRQTLPEGFHIGEREVAGQPLGDDHQWLPFPEVIRHNRLEGLFPSR